MSEISYPVPAIIQGSRNTCWLACFRMLARYQLDVGRQLNAAACSLMSPDVVARFESLDRPLNPDAFERVARSFGLSAVHVPGLTAELLATDMVDPGAAYAVLSSRGPFTMGVRCHGYGHALVVCSATDDADPDIGYIDPADGSWAQQRLSHWRRAYPPDGGALFVF